MEYRYALGLLTDDGRALEHAVVRPDWKAALDWTHFEGIRAGRLPAASRTGPAAVEPVWDGRRGEPFVAGFRATVRAADGTEVTREIPKRYVRGLVQEVAARLVGEGRLATGETFRWVLTAFPAPGASAPDRDVFQLEDVARPLAVAPASLAAFLAGSTFAEDGEDRSDVVPVFIPKTVLEEATVLARTAGDVETGGVLVGLLHRDVGAGGLFVEVTAQVPARHTVSTSTKLTFTADTWAAVHAAIALRRRGEEMAGWWHSHLDLCRLRNCPLERRRECSGAQPFFSAEDVHLHATCFPAGYQVGLLISESTADGTSSTVFGWKHGMVGPRGFHVLDPDAVHANERNGDATHAVP